MKQHKTMKLSDNWSFEAVYHVAPIIIDRDNHTGRWRGYTEFGLWQLEFLLPDSYQWKLDYTQSRYHKGLIEFRDYIKLMESIKQRAQYSIPLWMYIYEHAEMLPEFDYALNC